MAIYLFIFAGGVVAGIFLALVGLYYALDEDEVMAKKRPTLAKERAGRR